MFDYDARQNNLILYTLLINVLLYWTPPYKTKRNPFVNECAHYMSDNFMRMQVRLAA